MWLDSISRVVFTTSEARGVLFAGHDKGSAQEVFTKWVSENLDWVEAGLDEVEVSEVLSVEFDLAEFNNTATIVYLCSECADNECEANNEAHEVEVRNCEFNEHKIIQFK